MNGAWRKGGAGFGALAALTAGLLATSPGGVLAARPASPGAHRSAAIAPTARPAQEAQTTLTALPPAKRLNGTWALRVQLSGAVAPGSPQPRLHPEPPGRWTTVGRDEFFHPAPTLEPCAHYTLAIPAGTRARGERPLGSGRELKLEVPCPSTRALQEALSVLGYLPYRPAAEAPKAKGSSRALVASERAFAPAKRLIANAKAAPPLQYGTMDVTTQAALEVYEENNGLPSGLSAPEIWRSLLKSEADRHRNPRPYTFITVSEGSPETLEVHEGTKVVVSSPTNTGVPGAETPTGVFPIYARYVTTAMVGTDPDGATYDDPAVPWVNYFDGGDAVHGYERSSYGWPQSNGCVELPVETARRIFPMLQIGDLVVITG